MNRRADDTLHLFVFRNLANIRFDPVINQASHQPHIRLLSFKKNLDL